MDIGHFLLAIDPGLFRDADDFGDDVASFCDSLRATKPADPGRPVLVAGDPERRPRAAAPDRHPCRARDCLPRSATSRASGADWIMEG